MRSFWLVIFLAFYISTPPGFSDAFVSDLMSVAMVILRGAGTVFRWLCQFFLDFDRAISVPFASLCFSVRMNAFCLLFWILLLLLLDCRDLSKSGSPRFSYSCAFLQRSHFWHPVHSLLLVCNRKSTTLSLHCSDLDCSQIEMLHWALLAPRGCSGHLFLEQEAIKWRRRRRFAQPDSDHLESENTPFHETCFRLPCKP